MASLREAHLRHAAHYARLARRAKRYLTGAREAAWLTRLDADYPNLRVALRWSIDEGRAETALGLGDALWRFWYARGDYSEGQRWLAEALEMPAAGVAADVTASRGRDGAVPVRGTARTRRALMAARAWALNGAGRLAWGWGDYERSVALHTESLDLFQALGDTFGCAAAHNNVATAYSDSGDLDSAAAHYEQSLALLRELGNRSVLATLLNNLGALAADRGDAAAARRWYTESLGLAREVNSPPGVALALMNLAEAAAALGDVRAARAYAEESEALYRRLGDTAWLARVLLAQARVASADGQWAEAHTRAIESLTLLRGEGARVNVVEDWELLAAVAVRRGDPERAARLLGAAEGFRRQIGAPRVPADGAAVDRDVTLIRAAVPSEVFAAAWAAGEAATPEEATRDALAAES